MTSKGPRSFDFLGNSFRFFDSQESSFAVAGILEEFPVYHLESIPLEAGDIMIDIGAHCGIVSIIAAKSYPEISVYSYEPNPDNFKTLLRNIEENQIKNIKPFELAITADGRDLTMRIRHNNTGSGSAYKHFGGRQDKEFEVSSITLEQAFITHNINRCKLLKIDCEGAEHEILRNGSCMDRIDNIVGEFHMNETLSSLGYSNEETLNCVNSLVIGTVNIHCIRMLE